MMSVLAPIDLKDHDGCDSDDHDLWWHVAQAMYNQVLNFSQGDFKLGDNSLHELEVSPWCHHYLVTHPDFCQTHGHYHLDPSMRIFGLFKVKVVMLPLKSEDVYSTKANLPDHQDNLQFRHMAARVERINGRFHYIDWCDNRMEMR